MIPQVLIPNMDATVDVDIIEKLLESNLKVAEASLEAAREQKDKQDASSDVLVAKNDLEAHKKSGEKIFIKIGYMPAAKRTELEQRHFVAMRNVDFENLSLEQFDTLIEIARDACKWGIKGCDIPGFKYASDKALFRSKEYDVASDDVVELLEANGWLHVLKGEIMAYNTLGEVKKKK